ncbi:peptidase M23 family protein [Mycobacterium xenopi 4042]|uniref:Peptidase M23 family protein n=1 Tax=Mycobacterium xenopi 4042 TaxID=1299334 RepID=X8E8U1_MYCXE|nr:peptidase M23 family protein [Mycobacterium xenopi 4042]
MCGPGRCRGRPAGLAAAAAAGRRARFRCAVAQLASGASGVDLAGVPGQPVYAAGAATVVFAGVLAGRPVVSLAHPGGLHTSYEPVQATVHVGQRVAAATVIGQLQAGHPAAARSRACTGRDVGPAARADYLDPLGLLGSTPIRLKPLRG